MPRPRIGRSRVRPALGASCVPSAWRVRLCPFPLQALATHTFASATLGAIDSAALDLAAIASAALASATLTARCARLAGSAPSI